MDNNKYIKDQGIKKMLIIQDIQDFRLQIMRIRDNDDDYY